MRRAHFFIILSLFLGSQARGAEYDVGSNTSFASFSAAFTKIASDAPSIPLTETITVSVNTGTYSESVQAPLISQPLLIEAVTGESVNLVASGQAYGINVSGVANVTVQGFTIKNYTQAGIYLVNCSSAQVLNNTLQNNSTEIWIQGSSSSNIRGNSLFPNGAAVLLQSSPASSIAYNTSALFGSESSYATGFTLTNSAACSVSKNQIVNALNGIALIGSNAVTVAANAIIAVDGVEGISLDNASGCWVLNNLALGQETGLDLQFSNNSGITNNTIYNQIANGIRIKTSSGTQLTNNIIDGDTGLSLLDATSQNTLSSQYNDLLGGTWLVVGYSSTYATLSAWQATGNDTTNSISSDPQFVLSSGNQASDFILQHSSPCVGLGQNLSTQFTNDYFDDLRPASPAAWDQGFEALISTPPTPSPSFTASPVLPSPTVSPTATQTPVPPQSPTVSPSPTASPSPRATFTITPTYTATPYPIHANQLVSYPNPYHPNSGQVLNFVFDPGENVSIRIFDVAGAFVAELPGGSIFGSQGYATWNGTASNGQNVPPGLYLAIERSSNGSHFTKLTILY